MSPRSFIKVPTFRRKLMPRSSGWKGTGTCVLKLDYCKPNLRSHSRENLKSHSGNVTRL
jgi:hypothetical protein